MFNTHSLDLLQYVTSTTLPHIQEVAGMPALPPAGHKSHKNFLSVKSEAWRRLENIYQIDPSGLAQQVVAWTLNNLQRVQSNFEDLHGTEKLSLGTRRRDGLPHRLDHPMDTIDRLAAFLDTLPLKSAQRLFHILYKDTLDWKFYLNRAYGIDQNIFDYFLWGRTPQGNDEPENALVVAYQPPWILSQADFEEFVRCSALPPFVAQGHVYPSELQSKHRVWAKLWDTCVKHNTKWFIITSWNIWAFGAFSDGWCSGYISDIWHLDEHTPTVLECITFWIASAMGCEDGYQRPKVGYVDPSNPRHINMPARLYDVLDQDLEAVLVPEPLNALRAEIKLPASQAEVPTPAISESNWQGKSQDASISAHITSISASLSHQGLEGYLPPPIERGNPLHVDFIRDWRDKIINANGQDDSGGVQSLRWPRDEKPMMYSYGEWLA